MTLFVGNLSKRGWIDGHREELSWSRRTVMDSVLPYLMKFLLLLTSLPSTAGMTDRYEHNGPPRVSVPKHLNSWNMGTGATSLIFMTNLQDGPSWLRRSVTHSVTPHLVKIPHLPSAAALRCHVRTVTSTTNRHKLHRWYFLYFSLKHLRIYLLDKFPANKEKFT